MNFSKFHYFNLSLLILILLANFIISVFGQHETGIQSKDHPYKLISSLDETEVKLGDEITVKLELKNNDTKNIEVIEPLSLRNGNRIEIVDISGNKMPLSKATKKRFNQPSGGSKFAKEILPNNSLKYEFNLTRYYDLPLGKYRIFAWRYLFIEGKKPIEVKSNPVEISIVKELSNRIAENQKLIQILQNIPSESDNHSKFTEAIIRLGKRKSKEAIPSLINLLEFKSKRKINEKAFTGLFFDESLYFPAVRALANIGKPSLPSVIEIIKTENSTSVKSRNALHVIALIFKDDLSDGLKFLKDLDRAERDEKIKYNLQYAYRKLETEVEKINSISTEG